jgi:hypothetical protein
LSQLCEFRTTVINHWAGDGTKHAVRNICGARYLKKVTSRVDHCDLRMNG